MESTLKEGRVFTVRFASTFFKVLLNIPIETDDLSEVDPIFYR